jgi:hypothetical protein
MHATSHDEGIRRDRTDGAHTKMFWRKSHAGVKGNHR